MIMSLMGSLDCDLVVTFSELPDTAGITIRFCYSMIVWNELNVNMRGMYLHFKCWQGVEDYVLPTCIAWQLQH